MVICWNGVTQVPWYLPDMFTAFNLLTFFFFIKHCIVQKYLMETNVICLTARYKTLCIDSGIISGRVLYCKSKSKHCSDKLSNLMNFILIHISYTSRKVYYQEIWIYECIDQRITLHYYSGNTLV